jgi:hypothetical protein
MKVGAKPALQQFYNNGQQQPRYDQAGLNQPLHGANALRGQNGQAPDPPIAWLQQQRFFQQQNVANLANNDARQQQQPEAIPRPLFNAAAPGDVVNAGAPVLIPSRDRNINLYAPHPVDAAGDVADGQNMDDEFGEAHRLFFQQQHALVRDEDLEGACIVM